MRSIQVAALALATAQTAYSYVDTSPFFMFSTAESLSSATKLSTGEAITSEIATMLSTCPTEYYIIVSQPGVTASDYSKADRLWTLWNHLDPSRNQIARSDTVRSTQSIPDVSGPIDIQQWKDILKTHCGIDDIKHLEGRDESFYTLETNPRAFFISFNDPSTANPRAIDGLPPSANPAQRKAHNLFDSDVFLGTVVSGTPYYTGGRSYTVLYTTTPPGEGAGRPAHTETSMQGYEMDSAAQEMLHMDMKRDLRSREPKIVGNQTIIDGPLFEKYQFFTPGIYMGGLVALLLLSILYVGLSALSSLSVTYAAFDKDQGQLAKTKAQ